MKRDLIKTGIIFILIVYGINSSASEYRLGGGVVYNFKTKGIGLDARVEFPLKDRLVLIPVEFVHIELPMIVVAAPLWFLAGPVAALAAVAGIIAGTVLFPALLPYIPTQDLSTKGLILGLIIAIPFARAFATNPALPGWANVAGALTALLIIPAVVAYFALNFTGCTTYTSRTGVKKEIFRYVPVMALMAGTGVIIGIILGASRFMGMI